MSQPSNIGPLEQLLSKGQSNSLTEHLGWHTFGIKSPHGGEAGRWCTSTVQGSWTFKVNFGHVIFYIKDNKDAMAFKLVWHEHMSEQWQK